MRSGLVFAHIRASTGTPVQQTNCHPFRYGRWLWMHNGSIAQFHDVKRELMLAAAELRGQKQHHARSAAVTARRMADFLDSVEADEKLLPQRLKDASSKRIHDVFDGGKANSSAAQVVGTRALAGSQVGVTAAATPPVTAPSTPAAPLSSYEDY